jgi:hypothetical protein
MAEANCKGYSPSDAHILLMGKVERETIGASSSTTLIWYTGKPFTGPNLPLLQDDR